MALVRSDVAHVCHQGLPRLNAQLGSDRLDFGWASRDRHAIWDHPRRNAGKPDQALGDGIGDRDHRRVAPVGEPVDEPGRLTIGAGDVVLGVDDRS